MPDGSRTSPGTAGIAGDSNSFGSAPAFQTHRALAQLCPAGTALPCHAAPQSRDQSWGPSHPHDLQVMYAAKHRTFKSTFTEDRLPSRDRASFRLLTRDRIHPFNITLLCSPQPFCRNALLCFRGQAVQRTVANTVLQCHLFPPGRAQVTHTAEPPHMLAKTKLFPTTLLGKQKSSFILDTQHGV